jgi:hypothetical protein
MISLEDVANHYSRIKSNEWFPKPRNSYDRNRRQFIYELSLSFINYFKVTNCGLLTLTFAQSIPWKEAQHSLHGAFRRFLPSLFKGYITIVDFSECGRIHFHILCATDLDIKTGFRNDVYIRAANIHAKAKDEGRRLNRTEIKRLNDLAEEMTTNDDLKNLQSSLADKLRQFGFGRFEFTPIRETPKAIAKYLSNSLIDSINRRPSHLKRPKMWRESKNFPRELCSAQFRNLTEGSRAWRRKAGLVASAFGEKTSDGMKARFGRDYGYRVMQSIAYIDAVAPTLWHTGGSKALHQMVQRFF